MPDWRPKLRSRADGNPRIMGILNITPDSFHGQSRYETVESATKEAIAMAENGADWIDVGGESTRPGSRAVPPREEESRVVPVIQSIRDELPDIGISIDTRRSAVASASLQAGADMINDVSSLGDSGMAGVIVEYGCPVCLMHMKGTPENMQKNPQYSDVVSEVRKSLADSTSKLNLLGVDNSRIIVDPGIGFGKLLQHNLSLLSSGRDVLPEEDMGLMWGVSRKSMFADLLGRNSTEDRLAGSLGVASKARSYGVDIIRVHDVAEHEDLFSTINSLR
ncbi:MAG TPA: dihydropteroate synthase [Candidatus Thalassarchaeaceae archaeon]|nr:dihydropteroate synthase [Candidatus Thalassarchaeaceae archaeon]|tara:strand:+ start:2158 stop:2991 length:834 start_codon:yes stop_codon:yes gene_type:complete